MGHSVGKAAERATAKGMGVVKKEDRSPAQVIETLRGLRQAQMHVSPSDVDVLLAVYAELLDVYGKLSVTAESLQGDCEKYITRNNELMDAILVLKTTRPVIIADPFTSASERLQEELEPLPEAKPVAAQENPFES